MSNYHLSNLLRKIPSIEKFRDYHREYLILKSENEGRIYTILGPTNHGLSISRSSLILIMNRLFSREYNGKNLKSSTIDCLKCILRMLDGRETHLKKIDDLFRQVYLKRKDPRNGGWNWEEVSPFQEEDMPPIFKMFMDKKNFPKALYQWIITYPNDYLNYQISGDDGYAVFEAMDLNECACQLNCSCGEIKYSYRRSAPEENRTVLENKIVNNLSRKKDKSEQLTLCSLGCGHLFQDWVLVGQLIHAGFKNIKIVLFDISTLNPSSKWYKEESLRNFKVFMASLKGVNVDVIGSYDKDAFRKNNPTIEFDAVYAIDFSYFASMKYSLDGTLDNMSFFRDKIRKGGAMYMSVRDLLFADYIGNRIELFKDYGCAKESVKRRISQKSKLHILLMHSAMIVESWLVIAAAIQESKAISAEIVIIEKSNKLFIPSKKIISYIKGFSRENFSVKASLKKSINSINGSHFDIISVEYNRNNISEIHQLFCFANKDTIMYKHLGCFIVKGKKGNIFQSKQVEHKWY